MVLQLDREAVVWGWANPQEHIWLSLDPPGNRTSLTMSGPDKLFLNVFERTSAFTPKSGLVGFAFRIDDHGSLVISRSVSARPKHLSDSFQYLRRRGRTAQKLSTDVLSSRFLRKKTLSQIHSRFLGGI